MACFVYFTVSGMLQEDKDMTITTASTTRSETDQLKIQIAILQQEKTALMAEIDRYKATYGELESKEDMVPVAPTAIPATPTPAPATPSPKPATPAPTKAPTPTQAPTQAATQSPTKAPATSSAQ